MIDTVNPEKNQKSMMTGKRTDRCILLFMRAPVIGSVKTRLARIVGPAAALALYQAFILDILDTVRKTGIETQVYFDPPDAEKQVRALIGSRLTCRPQSGDDLGEKMASALARTFAAGYGEAVVIGTDCPAMTPEILVRAFRGIKKNDSVIGPSPDGGYYLIGFSRKGFSATVFRNIAWGTDTVCQQTMQCFQAMGGMPSILPELNDIDTAADLGSHFQMYAAKRPDTHTIRYLLANPEHVRKAGPVRDYPAST